MVKRSKYFPASIGNKTKMLILHTPTQQPTGHANHWKMKRYWKHAGWKKRSGDSSEIECLPSMQDSGPGNSSWVFFILLYLFLKWIGWGKWLSLSNNMIVPKKLPEIEWICQEFITQSQCTKLFYFYNLPIKILNLYMCVFVCIHMANWFCQKDNDNLLNRKWPFQQRE